MAKFNVPTKVTGPDEIEVKLVREDFYEMSNTFRTLFELSLSLTSAVIGAVLSMTNVSYKYYLVLAISGLATLVFLFLTAKYKNKARAKQDNK